MVQVISAQNVTLADLAAKFSLQLIEDDSFFSECFTNLPETTDLEKQYLDKVKAKFLRLIKKQPILENAVKMVIFSPLLELAGFYDEPFEMRTEESIEITLEDKGEIIRGRIDILIVQERLWLLVIESKKLSFSLWEAIPQALVYMLANPDVQNPVFRLVTNGEDFRFIKLIQRQQFFYSLSDKFTLSKQENELYKVLSILRKLGQILS